MSANSSLNLTSLDFDTLKQQFITYLSTQSVFKDYNFKASNINVLLDVMTYNSYLNAFYLNMVASEMFLDSAQKYDTVVSHAKELNYVPRSYKSATANVDLEIETTGITLPFSIPKGTSFSGSNSNSSFNFTTTETYTYTSPNSHYSISNLRLHEGFYVNNAFIMDYSNETQRFVLTNDNIDTDSLNVLVYENSSDEAIIYKRVDTLFGLTPTSNVYFLQAAESGKYEVLFGDGFLGRKPVNEALIVAEYIVSNGTDADGITQFSVSTDLGESAHGSVTVTDITVSSNSSGGANSEPLESIRFYAPRYFATQQRAVATDDYSSLILSKFGGTISDVNVYGGESLEPKQYGRVVISLKPASGTVSPDYIKNQISTFMLDYVSLPTRVIITDPDYFYCSIQTTIQYTKKLTNKLPNDIKSLVLDAIAEFSYDNLEKFDSDFRYSKFVRAIDDVDSSITSNNTEVKLIKRISPLLNYENSFEIYFDNAAEYESGTNKSVLTSSSFGFTDSEGVQYTNCYIKDDNEGNLIVYKNINNTVTILHSSLGTINYNTGYVKINKLITNDYDQYITLYLNPLDKDIVVSKAKILSIDLNDVVVNITETIK